MSHGVLSVKLCELDKKFERLYRRIVFSETASHGQIREEMAGLRKECAANREFLLSQLKVSHAPSAAKLGMAYGEVEEIIKRVREETRDPEAGTWKDALSVDEKILIAEYALDFAMQAANHALLISLEAIDAQMTQQETWGNKKEETE